ncbi:MAG: phospholipase D family protein [Muribaculaceae bacterium]|nr:phospholipase D family protein [Muribaculaceae bacterium]
MLQFISDSGHYSSALEGAMGAKRSLWIGTADIKDLYVEVGKEKNLSGKREERELVLSAERKKGRANLTPFLALIALLIRRGVEVRLIHAKEPGANFREDFDRYPALYDRLERVLCPRVHFKMLVFDCEEVYIGSANLTGAGIGMKSSDKRNFEAGILTDDPQIVEQAMKQFDDVWIGKHCKTCKRKDYCPDPIV